eukprot:2401363-Ditylum_brightwellii.AAC.1
MIRLKEAFNRNFKLASLIVPQGVTPKKSNVSSLTDNIDFDMSHINKTNNETKDNKSEMLELAMRLMITKMTSWKQDYLKNLIQKQAYPLTMQK